MDFLLRVLSYSLWGEIPGSIDGIVNPYEEPKPNKFYFSDEVVNSVTTSDEAWDLVESGIELWLDILRDFQKCESLHLLLEATTEQHVIVIFSNAERYYGFDILVERHYIDYRRYTEHDYRFADVKSHIHWMKVAYDLVDKYVVDLSHRVEAARRLFEQMIISTANNVAKDGLQVSKWNTDQLSSRNYTAKPPLEAAFASVREHFISTPEEVLQTITTNTGTIRLRRMFRYQAAMILEPLRVHYNLKSTRHYSIIISIEGTEPFHWFDEKRTLHNCLKYSKGATGSNSSILDVKKQAKHFAQDLTLFLPR